ncbi:hypothetical protein SAMN05421810_104465 [Amycolatopsis arida]|uniref:Uncharacterized protein n=1 Tax=Amycolatopsis arida TaxID=587909 RepID=A0A1I5VPK2_9PSEU|nr:hypothetical protein [Amycolatopsis arida]TDX87978.1 hypothetical protein CLV69_112111 [Amycolatopsis arida]SFQ09381.1 hypothetical protein SAMN05421810_104465 [Amycolatopsis arida]
MNERYMDQLAPESLVLESLVPTSGHRECRSAVDELVAGALVTGGRPRGLEVVVAPPAEAH